MWSFVMLLPIYRSLFLQARGVLDKQLVTHLRRVRTMRSSRNASTEGQGRGGIIGAVSIRDRPAEVADRLVFTATGEGGLPREFRTCN